MDFKCCNCGKEHDGSYGSGKFCSKHCRGAFTAKMPKKHKWFHPYECEFCHQTIFGLNALRRHKKEKHPEHAANGHAWNKGLTKETDERVAKMSATFARKRAAGWVSPNLGRKSSLEARKKISESMKRAHHEGRAHNIGDCRWNNKPSWPEQWFMQVVENEFTDKQYAREFPFHRFSLDFVWLHKKRCIEIDGEQHYRNPSQQERDKNKNRLLEEEGWKLLRLDWCWVYNHAKEAIKLAKDFIDS